MAGHSLERQHPRELRSCGIIRRLERTVRHEGAHGFSPGRFQFDGIT